MGLFDFLKSKGQQSSQNLPKPPDGFKWHLVDDIFYVYALDIYEFVKSDRFRLTVPGDISQISITNFEFSGSATKMTKEDFETNVLPIYKKYVDQGGYEPINDLEANDSYISQSFKVDNETHYCLTTGTLIKNKLIISNFLIRYNSEYDKGMRDIIKMMCKSIRPK